MAESDEVMKAEPERAATPLSVDFTYHFHQVIT